MVEKLQRRFALSRKGAVDTIKGSLLCALQNISFMLPVYMLYCLVSDMLGGALTASRIPFYAAGTVICAAVILVCTYLQYNSTFLATYIETGVRRIGLAEKLRRIPLSFFGKKDLADLTSAIMNDCAVLETSQSHHICPLIGAIISTTLIAISLFIFNWRMALASVWVLPVAFCIVGLAAGVQKKLSAKSMAARLSCEDGIQECMESMPDLRANNAERRYLDGLKKKLRAFEGRLTKSELGTAVFVVTASLVLRLGIATTALVGSYLLVAGELDIITFFMFLLVVSRLYDPLEGSLQNLAAIISTSTNIKRMNEILDHPVQEGEDKLTNDGCDIVFDHVGFAYDGGETVLRDVSFTAKQGEVTALVGPSGGGKTTVSRLAARFWDYQKGSITVGGMEVSKIDPEKLMSLYSIVFQDVTLFDNTILENIRLGRKGATDEEVLAAAKLANCEEFAEKLPDTEYQNCVDALFAAWDRLEKWSASLPMTAEKKAESERFQVLSRQKKTILTCCNYVTEVEFEVAEAGQPTRWLCYSDADFAGFVVTDRSSIADESKPQEYYEQVQVLENYEELEIARGSAYYALFAQMQKIAEEN